MSNLKYDPEFLAWRNALNLPPPPVQTSALTLREYGERMVGSMLSQQAITKEIEQSQHSVTSRDGTQITMTRFATAAHRQATSPQPALIFCFGGGMVSGSVELFAPMITNYVLNSGVQFFGVGYRRAPEYQAPTAVEDVFAALQWLSAHAGELAVDPARIGVTGVSAGGGIAAGTALLARDRGLSPPLAKQILVEPMLDDRTMTRVPETTPLRPFLSWTLEYNKLGWSAYVGADKAGRPDADVSPYAAPGRAESVASLPSTYIDVGNLDLFRDEDSAYAARLAAADVDVEFHVWPGVPHGFEAATSTSMARRAIESRIRAFKSF